MRAGGGGGGGGGGDSSGGLNEMHCTGACEALFALATAPACAAASAHFSTSRCSAWILIQSW
jgi:hypothetical protein